jgi:Fic family protein
MRSEWRRLGKTCYIDGNGRRHRWLFRHALALARFNPPGFNFPVSVAIYRRIEGYRRVLESAPAADRTDPTASGNVEVGGDTADFYRHFDATAHGEYLYACVEQMIERDMPDELRFLEAFEAFSECIQQIVDVPTAQVELLRAFLAQNAGSLSQRARTREFAALTNAEAVAIEQSYAQSFADGDHADRDIIGRRTPAD